MNDRAKPSPEAIRQARSENPRMRERDLASILDITEAEFVAAWCGDGVIRIEPRFDELFGRFEGLGEVMALTRNASAVHEKIGVYDNFIAGKKASMMLGDDIDMRMFPEHWVHAFAVEKADERGTRRSLQFFDAHGDAVHKIHLREGSSLDAWKALVHDHVAGDQTSIVEVTAPPAPELHDGEPPLDELRERWSRMTDTHQFVSIIRKLKLTRHRAVRMAGEDFAWQMDNGALAAMLRHAAELAVPIMCFVGNRGCIQIHSGPISGIQELGAWINILDPGFNLHLRADHVTEVWAVRKPTDKGHVTSLEAYDDKGDLIIQFFGKRQEGRDEREEWRFVMENLPRIPRTYAA